MNQAAGDRQILARQLNISPYQLSYVTNSGEGEGLLFYGNIIIPFKDRFNRNLKLYSLMTTKPEEVEKRKEDEAKAAALEERYQRRAARTPEGPEDEGWWLDEDMAEEPEDAGLIAMEDGEEEEPEDFGYADDRKGIKD